MTKETYTKLTGAMRKKAKLTRLLNILNKALTYLIFAAYPAMLVYLLIKSRERLPMAIAVPAVSFVLLSVFRRTVNFPRPYEVFEMPPVIPISTPHKNPAITSRGKCTPEHTRRTAISTAITSIIIPITGSLGRA